MDVAAVDSTARTKLFLPAVDDLATGSTFPLDGHAEEQYALSCRRVARRRYQPHYVAAVALLSPCSWDKIAEDNAAGFSRQVLDFVFQNAASSNVDARQRSVLSMAGD